MTTQIEATVTIHRYPNGNIDWEKTIRAYASDSDMSFREAMGWLSKRDTLEQAAQLLGLEVDLWNGNPKNKGIVNTLGAFLESKGYTVPRLRMFGHDEYINARPRQRKQQEPTIDMDAVKQRLETERKRNAATDVKEESEVSLTLTRDEYLAKRLSGMGRTEIAREQGLKNSGGLYYYLGQWGLKDIKVESAELMKLRGKRIPPEIPFQDAEASIEPKGPTCDVCGKRSGNLYTVLISNGNVRLVCAEHRAVAQEPSPESILPRVTAETTDVRRFTVDVDTSRLEDATAKLRAFEEQVTRTHQALRDLAGFFNEVVAK